ncbi:MAG: hypothetical protein A2131_02095 [Candidatus Sungbacteria bacterium GWC2_49_10]|uniref:Uncharacterized protein n=2 Tax=Parcubacteria group TaxID=1794811 RepID=A0A0G1WR50_9BACT|nr:MAG: hypothetical protein UY60_C0001G0030 [Parcubacteria group bacterium GW2011_GWB1_50_9]KKW21050.1 MAG: hypothetical protein UY61_C0016G0006 [Candidatus Adlerbacteria bacterium GW2011_GWC1_50_9]OGZ93304.1 MAG: hypothetical protein A2131_02095 [Candidatus Sungbacteria bacterium GWC2_49_10]
MKATTALGRVGNFPIHGTVVNIESTDIGSLTKAISSTAKFLVAAGAVTAGVIVMSTALQTKEVRKESEMPLAALAEVYDSGRRTFIGACLNDNFDFTCANQNFSVELNRIKSIYSDYKFFRSRTKYTIELIDDSVYYEAYPNTEHLSFLSLAGFQKLYLSRGQLSGDITITGVTPVDVAALRKRLHYAIANTRESVVSTIGEDVFSHFFK